MFLKRIELKGFKSFADKTELEFPKGITAVVGPNGSGKSNISDAVRWVLGEQSAKSLRGQKMEDVIFAGSDNRKPINYAEVSLVLDNECRTLPIDYSEVAVTRKVYRSGESEYLLNNQNCRLKDITELFMDTGLGKEAYSIIGQGRIEEVLSTKSEERRGIFEEAAGIVKYKSRKREAEKRLEETEANLVRVHDVMNELEDQIDPLKEASDKAEQYLQYKSDLRYLDISLLAYQIDKIDSEWKLITEEKTQLEEQLATITAELHTREADFTQLRWNLSKCEQRIDGLQQQFTEISTKVEKALGEKKVLVERKENNHSMIESMGKEIEQLQIQAEEKRRILESKQGNYSQLQEEFEKKKTGLETEIHQLESYESDLINKDEQTERLKGELIDLLHNQTTTKNELTHLQTSLETAQSKSKDLIQQQQVIEQNVQELEAAATTIQEKITTEKEAALQLQNQQVQARQSLDQAHRKWEQYGKEHQTLAQQLESKKDRKKLLQDMETEFAGYFQGTKEILVAKEQRQSEFKNVRGALVDLIQVPNEYSLAIETALGNALQHIVVDDERTAQGCIQYLKTKGKGRATFLPISIIKGDPRKYSSCEKLVGYIGYGNEIVTTATEYSSIINSLLGNVIIAKDIKAATDIAKTSGYRARVVTLDGDYVSPGGSMTGGSSQKKSASIMSRKNEIIALEQEITQITKEVVDKEQQVKNQRLEIEGLQKQIETRMQEVEKSRTLQIEYASQSQKLEQDRNYRMENLQMLKTEAVHYQQELERIQAKIQQQGTVLEQINAEHQRIETSLQNHQQQLKEQLSQKNSVNSKVTEMRIELAKYEEQLNAIVQMHSRDEQELKDVIGRQEKLHTDMQERIQQQTTIDEDIQVMESSIATETSSRDDLQRNIDQERITRKRLQDQVQEQEAQVTELSQQSKSIEKKLHQFEVKINRFDVELNNALNQLQEEYEMSFERAIEEFPLLEEPDTIKGKVKALKRNIQSLGEVNTGAIEEYQRVFERFHFLKQQREDLLDATNKLYQVIQEMNVEMEKRFIESFNQIRASFSEVFQQMFGGGRASLQLSDPTQILTTGIDIFAEPPGKKLQHLSLLSGGERALTAIALLFSILRVSPVPFCILDEVEAALDEANVTRFANYLRRFCDHTQFIVVTHRKGTMESADVLYGVTMEGSGVSKMVSVKLEDVIQSDLVSDKVEAS